MDGVHRIGRGLGFMLALLALAGEQARASPPTGWRVVYTQQDGGRIYAERCALCHGAEGRGKTDGVHGFPPLTGMSEWMSLREGRRFAAYALVFGPYGGVTVGDTYYNGIMSRFGHRFTNQQMIAVLRYVAEVLNEPRPGYVPFDDAVINEARRMTDHIDAVHAERDRLPPR